MVASARVLGTHIWTTPGDTFRSDLAHLARSLDGSR